MYEMSDLRVVGFGEVLFWEVVEIRMLSMCEPRIQGCVVVAVQACLAPVLGGIQRVHSQDGSGGGIGGGRI